MIELNEEERLTTCTALRYARNNIKDVVTKIAFFEKGLPKEETPIDLIEKKEKTQLESLMKKLEC